MLNKAIIFVLSLFLLSSCVTGPDGYFQRSANNKIFDRKGFKGSKRAPLYNKKYIAKAKQNVAINSYDEDDEDDDEMDQLLENENISKANREMYRYMLEKDIENKYLGKGARSRKNQAYPSLVKTSTRVDDQEQTENLELRAELEQIKSMLNDTKNAMANYRCPTAAELEKAQVRSSPRNGAITKANNSSNKSKTKSDLDRQPLENNQDNSTVIKPVKSI